MKLLLSAFVLLFAMSATFAQSQDTDVRKKKTPEERAAHMSNKMQKNLDLTADQKSKIYEIQLAHIKEMEVLKAEKKDKKEEIKKLRQEKVAISQTKIDGVLTADQKRKNDQLRAERKARQEAKRTEKRTEN